MALTLIGTATSITASRIVPPCIRSLVLTKPTPKLPKEPISGACAKNSGIDFLFRQNRRVFASIHFHFRHLMLNNWLYSDSGYDSLVFWSILIELPHDGIYLACLVVDVAGSVVILHFTRQSPESKI